MIDFRPFGEKTNFRTKVSQCRKTERGDPLGFLNTQSVGKHQEIEGGKFLFWEKNLTVPKKKLKGGTLWYFPTSILSQNSEKIEGGTLWRKTFQEKKSRSAEKNSPGMVCYAGKQEKPFWFSLLDQIVQFGAIIFCRTFKNYFGQFVWIEKKEKPL